ncbi:MAG: DUF4339 domain-containing protein [Muribaculaceae bacterium]|nr:DUF4339 domain-containing protein [Muribaculaceae bacterium]
MEFYVFIDNEQRGPYTIRQLEQLGITPETDVWTKGMPDWKPAGDVPELTSLLQELDYKRRRYEIPEERTYNPPAEKTKKKRGGCMLWGLLVTFVVLAVMIVTVPSREDHVGAIKDTTHEWVNSIVNTTGLGGSVIGEMAKWVTDNGADVIINQLFTCDNYFVCSVGYFTYGHERKQVSLGVLGHVFTFDKAAINEAIRNAIAPKLKEEEAAMDVAPDIITVDPQPIYPGRPQDNEENATEQPEQPKAEKAEKQGSDPARELLDTVAQHVKREALKAAKEWAKKKIDEM